MKNKILSKEILLLEPSDDHTHAHTNVLLCCGTVHYKVLHWCSLCNSVMFNHTLYGTPFYLYTAYSWQWSQCTSVNSRHQHSAKGTVPAKTSFCQYRIKIRWRIWFSYNGYRVFPGGKGGRGVMLTTHPLLVPRLRKSGAIPPLTIWVLLGLLRGSLYLYPFTWFSCWNAMSCYILRWLIISHELTVHLQLGFPGLTLETNTNKKGRRDNAKKSSVCQKTSQNNTKGLSESWSFQTCLATSNIPFPMVHKIL
jgi:hypothetical protein